MLRSMTGYGRAQQVNGGLSISFEIKSVNHRYFEFSSHIPRAYLFLEEKIKSFIKEKVSRGKTECFLLIDEIEAEAADVTVNEPLAKGYIRALEKLSDEYSLRNDATAMQIARFPDVLSVHKADADEEEIWAAVKPSVEKAVENFIAMREKEGEKLKEDVTARSQVIISDVAFVEERSPQTVKEYTEKLTERIKEVLSDTSIDESRILTEAAIYADKVAVAEETVRLRSHISQLHEMLEGDNAVGRKLDFLVQEMNREANTIGSKCQDVEITKKVLDMKAEIEKIREQIQNIE